MNYVVFSTDNDNNLLHFLLFVGDSYYDMQMNRGSTLYNITPQSYAKYMKSSLLPVNKKQIEKLKKCKGNVEITKYLQGEFPECFL